jgi:hypothetical protein
MNSETRTRLAKLFGRLGSEHAGERENALAAIDKALVAPGPGWSWICGLIEVGRLSTDDDAVARDRLLVRLVGERIRDCGVHDWTLSVEERASVRKIKNAIELSKSLSSIPSAEVELALGVADSVRRRVGR